MKFFPRISSAAAIAACLLAAAEGQVQSGRLVSKSISHVFAVKDKFIAFDEYGKSFSQLDLFASPIVVTNGTWPWPGGVDGGLAKGAAFLLLRSDSTSDSAHVGRVAGLSSDGTRWKISDSLVIPYRGRIGIDSILSRGAGLTAMTVWHDTVILGFGRLGIGYARLASDNSDSLFADSSISFSAFSSQPSVDTTRKVATCIWNRICNPDSSAAGMAGPDSVLALAVDSSRADSIWLLVATKTGLRRGLLGSRTFPRIAGIPDDDAVKNIVAAPDRAILWAFTDNHFFFSGDHGRSFHVPPAVSGSQTAPAVLQAYASTPQAVVVGDTTYVNFNLSQPGLVLFKSDSLRVLHSGAGEISDVLLDARDSLNIVKEEGSLTDLAVAQSSGQTMLVIGSNVKGIFYRDLAQPGKAFTNLNRLRSVGASLSQVITFPTLFGSELVAGVPKPVHIGYRLKKNGKVTITVFNSAMEKVCTVVKDKPRLGGGPRSENSSEDLWDGKDGSGRYVSIGTYYILVESDQGERGFGKAISLWGQR